MRSTILVWNPNPTLDIVSYVGQLQVGDVHRADVQGFSTGGKGTLLVRALVALGNDCRGIAPLAGPIGDTVARLLQAESLPFDISPVSGSTRAAVSIVDTSRQTDTVVNGPGPLTDDALWRSHIASVGDLIRSGTFDVFAVAGRPPLSSDVKDLRALCGLAHRNDLRVALDVSSPVLEGVVDVGPWLVKVNRLEARQATRHAATGSSDPLEALRALGAANVVLTDGPGTILARFSERIVTAHPPAVALRSAVGCGDCFFAGLLSALAADPSEPAEAVRRAAGVASAAAETDQPGYFSPERARALAEAVAVHNA